jgi:cyanophycinase
MANKRNRTLVIIGGREDKLGEKVILREIAQRIGAGKLVVATVATRHPHEMYEEYEHVFRRLGVHHIAWLDIERRADAMSDRSIKVMEDATAIFFTGGDQLRITSQLGDTPVFHRVVEIYEHGGLVAGTSAGASVMGETMLISGSGNESHRIGENLGMAPGLGLIGCVVIDQHFAERGRMGRLLGSIAQNPKNIGIGIDEGTAIVIEGGRQLYVLGSGAVYIIDGSGVTESNIADGKEGSTLSIYDLKLHVLSQGDKFDLQKRRPGLVSTAEAIHVEQTNGLEH